MSCGSTWMRAAQSSRCCARESDELVQEAIDALSRVEWLVIRGASVSAGPPRTLREIATELGISRERVRQIEDPLQGEDPAHDRAENPSCREPWTGEA